MMTKQNIKVKTNLSSEKTNSSCYRQPRAVLFKIINNKESSEIEIYGDISSRMKHLGAS